MTRNQIKTLLGLSTTSARDVEPLSLPGRVLIGTHHKTGTVWMGSVFRQICDAFGLQFHAGDQESMDTDCDVFLQGHSRFDKERLSEDKPYRGIHIIRDPRDTIVSGCFYHAKSEEAWLHVKAPEYGGLSYQEKLNSIESTEEQILFEMENSGRVRCREMLGWNYEDPAFLEVKYEDLIQDEKLTLFHEIFVSLGFPGGAIPQALEIAYNNSLFSGKLATSGHIRSGAAKQWEEHFTPKLRSRFIELFDDALVQLGYEDDHGWANK